MRILGMGRARTGALVGMLGILWAWIPGASGAPSVLGRLPTTEDMAISPAGTRLAFVHTADDSRIVMIYGIKDQKIRTSIRVSNQKLRAIRWIDEDRLFVETSTTTFVPGLEGGSDEWFLAEILDVRTGKQRPIDLVVRDLRTMNVIGGRPQVRVINGRTMLYVRGYYVDEHSLHPAIFSVDPDNGYASTVVQGHYDYESWLLGDDGVIAASIDYDPNTRRWRLKVRTNDRLNLIATGEESIEFPELLGFAPEPGYAVVWLKEDGGGRRKLMSLSDGKMTDDFDRGKDVDDLIYARTSERIIGGSAVDDRSFIFFDAQRQKDWNAIVAAYAGATVRLVSATDDFRKLIVEVDGAELGYYFELFDLDARRGVPLGPIYDGLTKIAPASDIQYAAADGTVIPAVLTLPRDKEPKALPLIVFPHGGPYAHDSVRFDWWREAMAEQGYAVLQPNFRGSDLSWTFATSGFGEFGRKMQTDLSAGVRHLVKQGIVDPARVCIVGASYGGYAALSGVTLDPGVYRCAVSVAGISDLARFVRGIKNEGNSHAVRYWNRFLGVVGPNDPLVTTISPIAHVGAITTPVLLIHGKDDTVVPYEQSEVMRDGMKKAGKTVEFVTLNHEDHWLSTSSTRSQMLEATLDFLRRNNPPD